MERNYLKPGINLGFNCSCCGQQKDQAPHVLRMTPNSKLMLSPQNAFVYVPSRYAEQERTEKTIEPGSYISYSFYELYSGNTGRIITLFQFNRPHPFCQAFFGIAAPSLLIELQVPEKL